MQRFSTVLGPAEGAPRLQRANGRSVSTEDPAGWDHFPHGADVGIHGWGPTPAEAFEQAALALTAICVDPASVRDEMPVAIACEAPTLDDLFVEWLNTVIFEMAARHMAFGAFRVAIADRRLTATASGEPLDPERHDPGVEPKGATYTALRVAPDADGRWHARCVVDV